MAANWWYTDTVTAIGNISHPFLDYQVRFGTVVASDSKTSSAIAEQGEAYIDFSIGIPLFSRIAPPDKAEMSHTLNLEYSLGITTDRVAQNNHTVDSVGLVFVFGIPVEYVQNKKNKQSSDRESGEWRKIEVVVGYYYVDNIEVPLLLDSKDNTSDTMKIQSNNGVPKYEDRKAKAIKASIHIPWGDNGFISFAGQLYDEARWTGSTMSVTPWTLKIGATISVDKLVKDVIGL